MLRKWTVCVQGRTYGPYTAAQMQSFAREGRLAPHSLIARDKDGPFGAAVQDSEIALLFRSIVPRSAHRVASADETLRSFGQKAEAMPSELSHYLIVADLKSGSLSALEEEIFRLGSAYPVMPQAWILATRTATGALRNLLVQKLGKLDQLFIANATQDKIAWVNLGMEAEIQVRRIWTKPSQLSAA
jgi:hypothetical protein